LWCVCTLNSWERERLGGTHTLDPLGPAHTNPPPCLIGSLLHFPSDK
jgi:hypothetical protein